MSHLLLFLVRLQTLLDLVNGGLLHSHRQPKRPVMPLAVYMVQVGCGVAQHAVADVAVVPGLLADRGVEAYDLGFPKAGGEVDLVVARLQV